VALISPCGVPHRSKRSGVRSERSLAFLNGIALLVTPLRFSPANPPITLTIDFSSLGGNLKQRSDNRVRKTLAAMSHFI